MGSDETTCLLLDFLLLLHLELDLHLALLEHFALGNLARSLLGLGLFASLPPLSLLLLLHFPAVLLRHGSSKATQVELGANQQKGSSHIPRRFTQPGKAARRRHQTQITTITLALGCQDAG